MKPSLVDDWSFSTAVCEYDWLGGWAGRAMSFSRSRSKFPPSVAPVDVSFVPIYRKGTLRGRGWLVERGKNRVSMLSDIRRRSVWK